MTLYAELAQIDGEDDQVSPGVIDADWLTRRRIGTATIIGTCADVGHSVWIAAFRRELASEILASGFTDFDAHAFYKSAPRKLTQHISRMVYDNKLDGIRYLSKHGLEAECWALFELRIIIRDAQEFAIAPDDPELKSVMTAYDLTFG